MGKVLAVQANAPKFRPPQTHRKAGWVHACKPSSGRERQVEAGGLLTCQASGKGELQFQWETLSQREIGD